jgi:hypothetical protein
MNEGGQSSTGQVRMTSTWITIDSWLIETDSSSTL